MVVVALVAGAALAHATWNVAIKRAGTSGAGFLWLTVVVGAIVFAPFGIASLQGVDLARWLPLAFVSGLLQVGYFLLLQRAYRLGDVSIVYP
ncbi:MAG: EamA family transporter, partial [Rhodoglobus sp.]